MEITLQKFPDVIQHAMALKGWQQEYIQLEAGHYSGETVDIRGNNFRMFREKANLAVAQTISFPDHQQHLAIPLVKKEGGPFKRRSISLLPHCRRLRASSPSDYDVLILSVDSDLYPCLSRNCQQMRLLAIDEGLLAFVRQEWQALTDYIGSQDIIPESLHAIVMRKIEDGLALLLSQDDPQVIKDESFYHTRRYIVDQCQAMIESSPDNPPSLMTLCRQLKISRRTLQYSFEAETGYSPLHYIRALRLNAVRRRLLQPEPITVMAAAAEQGFFHHSYFTRSYLQHFSELPSETVKAARLSDSI